MKKRLTVLEICAGGGGQAIGLEAAGFLCAAAVEIEPMFCDTLRQNRPEWKVIEADLRKFSGKPYKGVDLVAGGVPCPPFSVAGKQLGSKDERDLFPEALRIVKEARPKAVLLENVPGFASAKFESYRSSLKKRLSRLGYESDWRVLNAKDFGVPQLRPRFVLVAMPPELFAHFSWPRAAKEYTYVGETLKDLMLAGGWKGARSWVKKAQHIAPTIVGGSRKHGGPDLGPSRAKEQWRKLYVNGMGIADSPPVKNFPVDDMPKLTVRMAARVQGFPDDWQFSGRKTAQYRQVGNAFPPPVARAVGTRIRTAILKGLSSPPEKKRGKSKVAA